MQLDANAIYGVQMFALAAVPQGGAGGESESDDDPFLFIDPSFANARHILSNSVMEWATALFQSRAP